jgi:hypothetical protein
LGIDFDQALHVLCLGTPEQVKGLQWALDHSAPSRRQYKIYRAQIQELREHYANYDFVVLMLDLGQPVPVETLREVAASREGLCCFVQPTPGQLLALSEVSTWGAFAWDGVSFDEVAQRVDELVQRFEESIQKKAFLDSATLWIKKRIATVGQIQLLNPPKNWAGFTFRSLDVSDGILSIGMQSSVAHWKLPIPGDKEICEFRFFEGQWSLKILESDVSVELRGAPAKLRAGDQLRIGEFKFLVGMDPEVAEIYGIARKLSILSDEDLEEGSDERRVSFSDADLESYCASLLYTQASGELQVRSRHRRALVYFYGGVIIHAVSGAVHGLKALLRAVMWPDAEWTFFPKKEHGELHDSLRLSLLGFTQALQEAQKIHKKVQPFVPPPGVELLVEPQIFMKKEIWTNSEAKVLASVAEYALVRDVLNYCPLPDMEIYDTLITLRKQGLLKPVKSVSRRT